MSNTLDLIQTLLWFFFCCLSDFFFFAKCRHLWHPLCTFSLTAKRIYGIFASIGIYTTVQFSKHSQHSNNIVVASSSSYGFLHIRGDAAMCVCMYMMQFVSIVNVTSVPNFDNIG